MNTSQGSIRSMLAIRFHSLCSGLQGPAAAMGQINKKRNKNKKELQPATKITFGMKKWRELSQGNGVGYLGDGTKKKNKRDVKIEGNLDQ